LSLTVLSETAHSAEVYALARDIAGPDATLELQKLSFRIAEAQIELSRVRHARHHLLSSALSNPNPSNPEGSQKFAAILSRLAQNLAALDRYEDRALSRRKLAIRAFDQAQKTAATVHADFSSRSS
jgi:hypothetical protein